MSRLAYLQAQGLIPRQREWQPAVSAVEQCPCAYVPVVSVALAGRFLGNMAPERRLPALLAAMAWLTARHPGLSLYEGINGRPYTDAEKDAIAHETGVVLNLPCPFHTEAGGCLLGGLPTSYNRAEEAGKAPYGWLPTLVARTWAREEFRRLVQEGAVADAKVANLTRNEAL